MGIMILALLMLVAIDIAAAKWGFDSRDGVDSREWVRRRAWTAFH
jgi:hypothetical protein